MKQTHKHYFKETGDIIQCIQCGFAKGFIDPQSDNYLKPKKQESWEKEEWGGWKIVSDMLDQPDKNGIYPTSKCYKELYNFVVAQKKKAREEAIVDRRLTIWIAEYLYYQVNPKSKMDVPSIVYEKIEKELKSYLKQNVK